MWDMPLGEGKISLVNQALNEQKATKEHGKVSSCVIKVYVCRVRGVKSKMKTFGLRNLRYKLQFVVNFFTNGSIRG